MPQTPDQTGKVLLCIVSHQAEKQIAEVLLRIPEEVWDSQAYDVLVSDDASKDATVELVKRYKGKTHSENLKILKVFKNQGYGGNQKICYRYAIDHGYRRVILLPGGTPYAPEFIPQFNTHCINSNADIALGSGIGTGDAVSGDKRPLNSSTLHAFLTSLLNHLAGRHLSDFHAGCRAYSVDFLRSVPFELNSDGPLFDIEILLQGFHVNAAIAEFEIPVEFAGEICRAPGFTYACNAVLVAIQFKMQSIGIFTSLKYPRMLNRLYQAKFDDPYSTHSRVLKKLEEDRPARVLDIGCGPGWLGEKIRDYGSEITGVDLYEPMENVYNHFIRCDIEHEPISISGYDTILLLDILEHLSSPETFLINIRNTIGIGRIPAFHISVPNVGFATVRLNLLFGRFNYGERGILDTTHKRFFTRSTIRKTLKEAGYEVIRVEGVGVPVMAKGFFFKAVSLLSHVAATIIPSLFAFQFLIVARPKYTVRQIIEISEII